MDSYSVIDLDPKHFPLPLDVRWLGADWFVLLAPFEYHRRNGEIIRSEEGVKTDFGSKPKWVMWLVGSPTDKGGPAYVLHDEMCNNATWPRLKTDRIFLEMLRDLKVTYLKRKAMYYAVRLFAIVRGLK